MQIFPRKRLLSTFSIFFGNAPLFKFSSSKPLKFRVQGGISVVNIKVPSKMQF